MSKLIVCALMSAGMSFIGTVYADSGSPVDNVNGGISNACELSPLYNQYVCPNLKASSSNYDTLFKPAAAFLNPVVADDKGGSSGGDTSGGTDTGGDTSGGTDAGTDSGSEDYMSDGFQ